MYVLKQRAYCIVHSSMGKLDFLGSILYSLGLLGVEQCLANADTLTAPQESAETRGIRQVS